MKQVLFLIVCVLISGCGSKDITLKSAALGKSGTANLVLPQLLPFNSADEFKFCVTKIRLQNESGSFETRDDISEFDFKVGTVSLGGSNAGNVVQWGSATLPVDFKLKKLFVLIASDTSLCSSMGDSSMSFSTDLNPKRSTAEIQLRFLFEPAIELKEGDSLTLDMLPIARAVEQASSNDEVAGKASGADSTGKKD